MHAVTIMVDIRFQKTPVSHYMYLVIEKHLKTLVRFRRELGYNQEKVKNTIGKGWIYSFLGIRQYSWGNCFSSQSTARKRIFS